MFGVIDHLSQFLPAYLLIFARISGLMISMPVFSYSQISVHIRVMLTFVLTIIISPLIIADFTVAITSVLSLFFFLMGELFIGLLIGFGARLVFEGFAMAGSFIGLQMGMAIMTVFDPTHEEQQPIISNLWIMVVVVFFLVTNSHYFLIETLFYNFKMIKLGAATLKPGIGQTIISGGSVIYDLALKFAAPSMIFLLTVDVAIAFMARVMPQLNIFFISLPLKLGIGIILLIISLRIFQGLFSYIINEMQVFVHLIIRGMQ